MMRRLAGRAFTMRGILIAAMCVLPFVWMRPALADLMINPARIVFDGSRRAAQIDLINNGTEPATYRIGVVNRRMSETGEFLTADNPLPDEKFADHLLFFSPRQVRLMPGKSQVVRLVVRKPADLPDGEYRSHLLFSRMPEAAGDSSIEQQGAGSSSEVGVRLTALVSVTIPVIVRQGETAANVTIEDVAVGVGTDDKQPLISFSLRRAGNRSVYGDLVVSFKPDGGEEQVIGKAGGIAIYTPNLIRRASFALSDAYKGGLGRGVLTLVFKARPEEGGATLAKASIVLP